MLSLDSLTIAITYTARSDVVLPAFAGRLWRGTLGSALRDTLCFSKRLSCEVCFLRRECLYNELFHNGQDSGAASAAEQVKPFVIHAPMMPAAWATEAGGSLGFAMSLFSRKVWNRLPYLVAALHLMGRRGIGPRRSPLDLDRVDVLSPLGGHLGNLYEAGRIASSLQLCTWPDSKIPHHRRSWDVEIDFLTPLRLERKGQPVDEGPPFAEFLRALLRRRHYLLDLAGEGAVLAGSDLEREESEALNLADSVGTAVDIRGGARWHSVRHYSGREKKLQSLGGLVGKVRYLGVPSQLLPLLLLGVLTHVGKRTTHGLGAYALTIEGHRLAPPFWAALRTRNE